MATALVLGASGATGGQLGAQLAGHPDFTSTYLLSRRALGLEAPNIKEQVAQNLDFGRLEIPEPIDVVFCALGTTIKDAGSKEAFYRVDHDLIASAGLWAKTNKVKQFHLISSLRANPQATHFYLRTKGQTEKDLIALDLPALFIYRPSVLHAPLRPDFRLGESVALGGLSLLKALPFAWAKQYRPVAVADLAAAMIRRARIQTPGLHIIESAQIAQS